MPNFNKSHIGRPHLHHLTDNGTESFIGDYSAAPMYATWQPNPQHGCMMTHLKIFIEDDGTMDTGKYGNKLPLVNGIKVEHIDPDGNVYRDLLDGDDIFSNSDWMHRAERIDHYTFWTGNEILVIHFEFWPQWGQPWYIEPGARLQVTLQDDFTGLIAHKFHIVSVAIGQSDHE